MEDQEPVSRVQKSFQHAPIGSTLSLDPVRFGLSSEQSISLHVTHRNQTEIELRCRDITFFLSAIGPRGTVEGCLQDLEDWIADAVASKLLVGDMADLLLVHPSSAGGVWLCSVRRHIVKWQCKAMKANRPSLVSTDYALPGNSDQLADLVQVHRAFIELAGPVIHQTKSRDTPVLLRVKVHPGERWFLRFPLGVFAKFRLASFEPYFACQWIVTDRTICTVAAKQVQTEREIANPSAFLEGAHIVVNTYHAHTRASDTASMDDGFRLLVDVLEELQNVPFQNREISLKWTLNPSTDQLNSILKSESTRFLFADFEAAGGFWTLGDGPHRCHTKCNHTSSLTSQREFDLSRLEGCLAHVRLMRVFHCNSLYDPYKPTLQPADDGTIAAALLATSAFFVECSPTAEPVIDFFCTILSLLLSRADLRAILFAKSLSGGSDISNLISRANDLLRKRGFIAIT